MSIALMICVIYIAIVLFNLLILIFKDRKYYDITIGHLLSYIVVSAIPVFGFIYILVIIADDIKDWVEDRHILDTVVIKKKANRVK